MGISISSSPCVKSNMAACSNHLESMPKHIWEEVFAKLYPTKYVLADSMSREYRPGDVGVFCIPLNTFHFLNQQFSSIAMKTCNEFICSSCCNTFPWNACQHFTCLNSFLCKNAEGRGGIPRYRSTKFLFAWDWNNLLASARIQFTRDSWIDISSCASVVWVRKRQKRTATKRRSRRRTNLKTGNNGTTRNATTTWWHARCATWMPS